MNTYSKTKTTVEFLIYLIKENYYKKDTYIKSYIINFIQLYCLKIFLNSNGLGIYKVLILYFLYLIIN